MDVSYLSNTFSFIVNSEDSFSSTSNTRRNGKTLSLAGCSCPGANGPLLPDLEFLKMRSITSVVSLHESASIDTEVVKRCGFYHIHLPVPDYRPPTLSQMKELLMWLRETSESTHREGREEKIVVHCNAGMGRTGTVLACLLVYYYGLSAKEAVAFVRGKRRGSVQTYKQEDFVGEFERFLLEYSEE